MMSRGACVAAVVIVVVAGCRRSAERTDAVEGPRIADAVQETTAVAPAVPDAPAPGNDVGTSPAVDAAADESEPPSFVWGEGDRASLPAPDARFLELIVPAMDDFHMVAFRLPPEQTTELGPQTAGEIPFGGRTLRRLPVTATKEPASTGALNVTFWKTDDGLYFVRTFGGCVAARDFLYGPFRAQGDAFVFARDARAPTPQVDSGSAPPCAASPTAWCPPLPGDPCSRHPDAASCVADPHCVVRPFYDDTLRPCGEMDLRCQSPGCPAIGCAARCDQLATEAECLAQAPRCLWAAGSAQRCYTEWGDCVWP
jgi:hypothetical protein